MALRASFLRLLLLTMTVIPAAAQYDVYDNGPIDGQTWASVINFGLATSNSFNFTNQNNCGPQGWSSCSVNGLVFEAWLFPGDILQSVEVSITSSEFGGTTYFDQVVNFSQSDCFLNNSQFGSYDVCTETGNFHDINLNTGTYWVNLQNASTSLQDPVFWDENNGPSLASTNSIGTIPSESFTILGSTSTTSCSWCGTVPEPDTFPLLAFGAAVAVLASLRKLAG